MSERINLKKRLIGKEDINFDTFGTHAFENFTTPDGGTKRLTKINASHIPLTSKTREKIHSNNVDDAFDFISNKIENFKMDDVLTEDTTIHFDRMDSIETIQQKIYQQKKNLNGYTLTFLFPASLSQDVYESLIWQDFFNGTLVISSDDPNYRVAIKDRQDVTCLFKIYRCQCEVKIEYFDFYHQYSLYGIYAESASSVIARECNFYGMSGSISYAICKIASTAFLRDCEISDDLDYYPYTRTDYLPTDGSTPMIGSLSFELNGEVKAPANGDLMLMAGSDYNKSPHIFLRGADFDENEEQKAGEMFLIANNGKSKTRVVLRPDGTFSLDGKDITLGYPNYAAGVQKSFSALTGDSYSAPEDGYVTVVGSNTDNGSLMVYVGSVLIYEQGINSDNRSCCPLIPVKKGYIVKAEVYGAANTIGYFKFFPNR